MRPEAPPTRGHAYVLDTAGAILDSGRLPSSRCPQRLQAVAPKLHAGAAKRPDGQPPPHLTSRLTCARMPTAPARTPPASVQNFKSALWWQALALGD